VGDWQGGWLKMYIQGRPCLAEMQMPRELQANIQEGLRLRSTTPPPPALSTRPNAHRRFAGLPQS